MKHILLVVVAIVAVVISSSSSAWQAVGSSQASPELEQARQFLNNYPTEPFMNEERLSDFADARGQQDILKLKGYDGLRTEGNALDRQIKDMLEAAKRAVNSGDTTRLPQLEGALRQLQYKVQDLAERWDKISGATNSTGEQTTRAPQRPAQDPAPIETQAPGGPETVTSTPTPTPPPSVLGVTLTTTSVVTTTAVVVGVGVAVNNAGDETTDTTGGNN